MNSVTLKPEIKELYKLNEFISNILPEKNLNVDLIVEEIFVNIVNYSKTEFITVSAENVDSKLIIEFIDNGIEFNPLLIESPKPVTDIEDAQIGGLGIFLTKEMTVEIDYNYMNGENHLKIVKQVQNEV